MTVIETNDLTKRYESTTAVAGVDLRVERGEIYGFLGPNGAGKSTTIALLLDYVRPTSGSARVFGMEANRDAVAISRRTGVLPENCALYDRLTGREHLEFAIRATGSGEEPDRLLDRVGLDEAGNRPAGEYSTGMTQRLKLALALVGDPDLLILDEPSSGLDPNGIKLLRELVVAERERGTTVFFSSHILEHVEAVCDRIGIMVDGRLAVDGDLDALREERGPAMQISIETADAPQSIRTSLESNPAVTDVRTRRGDDAPDDGASVVVAVEDDSAKVDVLRCVENETEIRNFTTDRGSLESLFERYVRGER